MGAKKCIVHQQGHWLTVAGRERHNGVCLEEKVLKKQTFLLFITQYSQYMTQCEEKAQG